MLLDQLESDVSGRKNNKKTIHTLQLFKFNELSSLMLIDCSVVSLPCGAAVQDFVLCVS